MLLSVSCIFVADGGKTGLQDGYLLIVAGDTEIFQIVISEQVADSRLPLDIVKSEDKSLFHKFNLILPATYMRTDMHLTRVLKHIPVVAAVDDIVPIVPVAHRVYKEKQDILRLICSPVSGAAVPEKIRFLLSGFRNRPICQGIPYFFNRCSRNRLFLCPDTPVFAIVPSRQRLQGTGSCSQMAIDGVIRLNLFFCNGVAGIVRVSSCYVSSGGYDG